MVFAQSIEQKHFRNNSTLLSLISQSFECDCRRILDYSFVGSLTAFFLTVATLTFLQIMKLFHEFLFFFKRFAKLSVSLEVKENILFSFPFVFLQINNYFV